MKKIFAIISVSVLACGCHFLDENMNTHYSGEDIFGSEAALEAYVTGCYQAYATSGFYKDQKITTEEYARLSSLHHYSHAYSSVIRKLTMKDCSESEIREVLTNHKYLTEEQRTEILSEMKQKGFINDEELVRNYIEIAQGNLYGSNRIRASLLKKGIERELIDSYLCSDESEDRKGTVYCSLSDVLPPGQPDEGCD